MDFFTSESVTEGHPDKLCDAISDAVVDAILAKDPAGRVAVEVMITHGIVFIGGEITTDCYVDIPAIARSVVRDAGYTDPAYGFHFENCGVMLSIQEQSKDIARGVQRADKREFESVGAGDQGCLKKGTLVRTKKGFIAIEEVAPGDYVATPQGWRRVVKSSMTGRKKIIEIIFANGSTLKCTPDHKILCYRGDGTLYWKAAADLTKDEFVCALKPQETFSKDQKVSHISRNSFFSKYNHKIFGPEKIMLNNVLGYMTGELIGDGYVADTRCMDLAFGTNRSHAIAVQEIINTQMPHQWHLREQNGSICLKIDSVLARKHFENFGVTYAKAPYKTTPCAIFTSPKEVIQSYLRGLFDSDGTIVVGTGRNKKNIRIRLCSSSLMLLRETQLLLNDFGITSSILRNRPAGTPVGKKGRDGKIYRSHHENYVLSLIGFESYQRFCTEIGFFDAKKQERALGYIKMNPMKPRNSRGIFLLPHPKKNEMVAEERIGKSLPFTVISFQRKEDRNEIDEVYDLEIEGVHIFSANGIFVHNSMFGYATNETPQLMPLPIMLAHALTRRLAHARKKKILSYLRPDGKAQVTLAYENGKPVHADAIVVAAQHDPDVSMSTLHKDIKRHVIAPIVPAKFLDAKTKYFINATGRFVIGGPQADTGLTGRKIISDTYGGMGSHGGGAFSGKDPTKVDRSGAYMARYIAKHIVAAKLAKRCEVQLAYAIGVVEPLSFSVHTFDTGTFPDEKIMEMARKIFDLRPGMIIKHLGLQRPLYRQVATYGHFGRTDLKNITWEQLDKVEELKQSKP